MASDSEVMVEWALLGDVTSGSCPVVTVSKARPRPPQIPFSDVLGTAHPPAPSQRDHCRPCPRTSLNLFVYFTMFRFSNILCRRPS